jgi:lipopolysaccharide export LptBFGC system permease protein LptF
MPILAVRPFALLKHRFVRDTLVAILKQISLIVLLIEAIFLGEKFAALFDAVVEHNGRLSDIFLVLMCTSPEVFDLALALALLLAVYQVMLRARENRELLVLAGAGMGTRQLLAVLVAVGGIAQATSMIVSGAIEPAAHYASRVVLFNAQYRALRQGAVAGQFYRFPKHVAFVSTPKGNPSERRLFLEEEHTGGYRVMTADEANLAGPDAHGILTLELLDFNSFDFDSPVSPVSSDRRPSQTCPLCPPQTDDAPPVTMRVKHMTQRVAVDQLVPFDPRGTVTDEWTIFELLGIAPPPVRTGEDTVRVLGDRIARGVLCLLAPFLALTALAFTSRRTQPFAMPAAFLSLMALNLVDTAIVRSASSAGPEVLTIGLLLAAMTALGGLIALLVRVEGQLIRPAMARP